MDTLSRNNVSILVLKYYNQIWTKVLNYFTCTQSPLFPFPVANMKNSLKWISALWQKDIKIIQEMFIIATFGHTAKIYFIPMHDPPHARTEIAHFKIPLQWDRVGDDQVYLEVKPGLCHSKSTSDRSIWKYKHFSIHKIETEIL